MDPERARRRAEWVADMKQSVLASSERASRLERETSMHTFWKTPLRYLGFGSIIVLMLIATIVVVVLTINHRISPRLGPLIAGLLTLSSTLLALSMVRRVHHERKIAADNH